MKIPGTGDAVQRFLITMMSIKDGGNNFWGALVHQDSYGPFTQFGAVKVATSSKIKIFQEKALRNFNSYAGTTTFIYSIGGMNLSWEEVDEEISLYEKYLKEPGFFSDDVLHVILRACDFDIVHEKIPGLIILEKITPVNGRKQIAVLARELTADKKHFVYYSVISVVQDPFQ